MSKTTAFIVKTKPTRRVTVMLQAWAEEKIKNYKKNVFFCRIEIVPNTWQPLLELIWVLSAACFLSYFHYILFLLYFVRITFACQNIIVSFYQLDKCQCIEKCVFIHTDGRKGGREREKIWWNITKKSCVHLLSNICSPDSVYIQTV